ncbi:hypothetical protein MTO96_021069 [Rhipicephalus appendiculatus]
MSSLHEVPSNANEDVLMLKLDQVQNNLQSLDISNCIVARPKYLLMLLSRQQTLQTLSCISCPLKPSLLLDRLLKTLRNVTDLEFSIAVAKGDMEVEVEKIQNLRNVYKNRNTHIRHVYVDVADIDNIEVLRAFLRYCPLVTDFSPSFWSVRAHKHRLNSSLHISEHLRKLGEFKATCETQSTKRSEPLPLDLLSCFDMPANMVFMQNPMRFNYAHASQLALSQNPELPDEPVVLVAVDRADLDVFSLFPGRSCQWGNLRSLLSNIVELNINSVHFDDGIDFTELLATTTLSRLRALSLTPCSLQKSGAVRRLALGLRQMEDLDIRLNMDGRHNSCNYCDRELLLSPEDASAFNVRSRRLTLSNVPHLASLDFLKSCPVSHLRFIDVSDRRRFDFRALVCSLHHRMVLCSSNLQTSTSTSSFSK